MKRFAHFVALADGEALYYTTAGVRHQVSGVTSVAASVLAQAEGENEPTFFAYVHPGEFKFDVGHDRPFAIYFEKEGPGRLSVYRNPDALELRPDSEDTWTTVEHRPAINPQVAAIQRQLRALQLQVMAGQAAAKAKAKRQAVMEQQRSPEEQPEPEPKPEPAPKEETAE